MNITSNYGYITEYYGWVPLLTRGKLTEPPINSLFTKITTICERMELFANDDEEIPTNASDEYIYQTS